MDLPHLQRMLTFLKHAKRLEHHYLMKSPPNSRARKSFIHDDTSKGVSDEIKSVQEILRKVKLGTESKMHHVNKMFSKATENVNDAIKKSNKILSEELDRNEKVVSGIMKKVNSQSTQLKDCIDKYKGDVHNARNDFSHEIKDCNKNAIIALEGIKSNCEVPIKEAQEFKANVKHLLKQCLQTKGATTKCLTEKMNEMVTRYNEIFGKLNEIPKNTDSLLLKNIKDMTDCHQEAHRKLQKNLREIVEKTEKCDTKECMGANSSNANNQTLTLEAVLEEAEEVLRKATEIVSQTIQHEFTELQNYEEKAATTASNTIKTINQKLAELSEFSEKARLCIAKKEAELQGVELKMKNTLADCYRKQYVALEKFRTERLMIHEEAKQMKFDTQKIIQNCISSDDQLKCFELGIKDVRKRMSTLYEKFETLAKKETEARVKCTKLIQDCDKKAMESGHKKYMEIIDEIRKCIN